MISKAQRSIYEKKRRMRKAAKGICTNSTCKRPAVEGGRLCKECREHGRVRVKNWRNEPLAKGAA